MSADQGRRARFATGRRCASKHRTTLSRDSPRGNTTARLECVSLWAEIGSHRGPPFSPPRRFKCEQFKLSLGKAYHVLTRLLRTRPAGGGRRKLWRNFLGTTLLPPLPFIDNLNHSVSTRALHDLHPPLHRPTHLFFLPRQQASPCTRDTTPTLSAWVHPTPPPT